MNDVYTRRRIEDVRAEIAANDQSGGSNGPRSLVLKTSTYTTYPTTAADYYYCQIVRFGGSQAEGASPTQSLGSYLYAANIGGAVPPVGTLVLASEVAGGRWVFSYG